MIPLATLLRTGLALFAETRPGPSKAFGVSAVDHQFTDAARQAGTGTRLAARNARCSDSAASLAITSPAQVSGHHCLLVR